MYVLLLLGSCLDKFPDFEVKSEHTPNDATSPILISYGDTAGNFITCEKKCKNDWNCYAFTQYFVGEFPNSGLCYGRGFGEGILVAIETAYVAVSGVKVPCRYGKRVVINCYNRMKYILPS